MKWRPDPVWAARMAGGAVAALLRTSRWEIVSPGSWRALHDARAPFLFLLWHEVLLPLLWLHRHQGIAIVVSEARDGRYLAEFASRLGYRCVYGSSTRGGARALLEAVRVLGEGVPVAITPDGPRGPRRVIKPGILAAAAKAGVPIVPIHAAVDRAWRLRSWDRFLIPKPFATIRVGYGEALRVTETEGRDQAANRATAALTTLEEALEWPGATATG